MRFLLLGAALLMTPSAALAADPTFNFLWDDCSLGAYSTNKVSTCDSNIGPPYKMVVSLVPGSVIEDVIGAEGVIELAFNRWVPDFWRVDPSGCFPSRMSVDAAVGRSTAPFTCSSPWDASAISAISASVVDAYHLRITWLVAVPPSVSASFTPDHEWYLVAINQARAGTLGCRDCEVPGTFTTMQIQLYKPAGTPGGDVLVLAPALSQSVTWQGIATPARSRTWGQIKSSYRE